MAGPESVMQYPPAENRGASNAPLLQATNAPVYITIIPPPIVPACISECLGERLWQVVREIHHKSKEPIELIVGRLIAALSIVSAPNCRVTDPTGKVGPVTVPTLVAISADMTTANVDRFVFQPIDEFNAERASAATRKTADYLVALELWRIEKKAALAALRKEGRPLEEYGAALAVFNERMPKPSRLGPVVWNKISECTLLDALQNSSECAALVCDENVPMFDKHFSDIAEYVVKGCTGRPFTIGRGKNKGATFSNPVLTFGAVTRWEILQKYYQKHRAELWAHGLLGHTLFLAPPPVACRMHEDRQHTTDALEEYHAFMRRSLATGSEIKVDQRTSLTFDRLATIRWFNYCNEIERLALPMQYLSDMPDVATTFMDFVRAMAGLLHFVVGNGKVIPVEVLERAWCIAWHRAFAIKRTFTVLEVDVNAAALEHYFHRKFLESGQTAFNRSVLLVNAPRCVRDTKALTEALRKLRGENKIEVENEFGKDVVRLLPYFQTLPRF